jgi:hypothetical protein
LRPQTRPETHQNLIHYSKEHGARRTGPPTEPSPPALA